MIRKALIVYMTNSPSGELDGPACDYDNFCSFLTSSLGGEWYDNEIIPLENPTKKQLKDKILSMTGCDYAFTVFTGHGEFETDDKLQYIELMDGDVSIRELIVSCCKKQTIIIDACRGFFSMSQRLLEKAVSSSMESYYQYTSTRELYDSFLKDAEEGLTVLYAASENQTALDTDHGAAYILSLIGAAEIWDEGSNRKSMLSLKEAHEKAIAYMKQKFPNTIQKPTMNGEKRLRYYPFAVKHQTLFL